jgi:hypothetical protein
MKMRVALVISLLLLAAFIRVPFDYPKTASTAMPSDLVTRLGTIGADWQQEHGDLSGILGLSEGVDALGARIGIKNGTFADQTFPPPKITGYEEYHHPWVMSLKGVGINRC